MIGKPTVLILGAGASVPYGFPSGRGLLLRICQDLASSGDYLSRILMRDDMGYKWPDLLSFRLQLQSSMQPSVDAFLEQRPEFMEIGKAAIATELIRFEDETRLERQISRDLEWYEYMFNRIGTSPSEFEESKLSIITFNYDRSLTHFLFVAIQNAFAFDEKRAATLLKNIPVIHVYGKLGALPYIDDNGRPYDTDATTESIHIAASGMRILHESSEETVEFKSAHNMMRSAKKICFLGFGYHPINMKRLHYVEAAGDSNKIIQGSVYGLGTAEQSRIGTFLGNRIRFGLPTQDLLNFLRENVAFD